MPGLRLHYGVVVAAKAPSAGGQEIPLEQGDVIHSVNNQNVASLDDLRKIVDQLKPGGAVVFELERPGRALLVAFEWE